MYAIDFISDFSVGSIAEPDTTLEQLLEQTATHHTTLTLTTSRRGLMNQSCFAAVFLSWTDGKCYPQLTSHGYEWPSISGKVTSSCRRTCRFYDENRELLYASGMMPPRCLHCDISKVEFLVRGIFPRFRDYRTITRRLPTVLHGTWQTPGCNPVFDPCQLYG